MTDEEFYRPLHPWMNDDQWECAELLANIHGGFNHMFGKMHKAGDKGIRFNSKGINYFATFDFDGLTKLVVLAHERMIRVEIIPSGPGMIGFVMHKRHSREGRIRERHPTIEEAVAKYKEQTK